MTAAPPYLAGCHSNESRALYKVSPLPVRTVTTADTTAARLVLAISAQGNLRSETMKAFTEAEYKKIMASLP